LKTKERPITSGDLFIGRKINVGFRANGKLVIETKDGDVVAQKVDIR